MEVQEIMTAKVITVGQDEPVTAAARLLRRWNLGALPVTDSTGRLRGVLWITTPRTRAFRRSCPARS